jgi:hypothetical protein
MKLIGRKLRLEHDQRINDRMYYEVQGSVFFQVHDFMDPVVELVWNSVAIHLDYGLFREYFKL